MSSQATAIRQAPRRVVPSLERERASAEVIALARFAGARGWVPATSGNFSARIDGKFAAITASGREKSEIEADGVMVTPLSGPMPVGASAEAHLHFMLYRLDPGIGAIAHTHSHAAILLSRRHGTKGALVLTGFELQKAIRGVTTHEAHVELPIVANDQDTAKLAQAARKAVSGRAGVYGFLIEGHGLYAWGSDGAEARRHLEAYEALLALVLAEEGAN